MAKGQGRSNREVTLQGLLQRGGTMSLPNRDAFKMAKHIHVSVKFPDEDEMQVEAAKTARLRAFRLAKEAADRDTTNREIAAAPPRGRRRHQLDHPRSRVS
jgi:hypothetical protein